MMKIMFLDNKHWHLEKRLSRSQRDEILLKEVKEEGLFQIELCQATKDSNKLFACVMSDMSKSFMLMTETMKISIQKVEMIQQQQRQQQQQQQQQQQHSMVSAYQPNHHSHLYSVQQAQQRRIFHTMNNAHESNIMSTPPQTM